ncbi:MAG: Unknown protein [uncultured Sulfurovum sp.]|uniref:Cytochrome c domain-containing protein n=1 Tax=uncultured Sulfurovum sp. TaxID=269237 RepID=A0A6S6TZI7_9BACT|nr:MAG: Unknown protein [uncultured Sulfurovum sp.]
MKIESKSLLAGYSLTLCFALVGCGGGSNSSSSTDNANDTETTKSTYSVSGTVPGTLIEAFCKDGSYYKVNSTKNGTTSHPFSITLPSDMDCKFIMTTNEDDVDTSKHIVTPLLLNDGTTTSSYFQLSNDLELGHVALPMTGSGVQTPLTVSASKESVEVHEFSYDPLDTDNDGTPNVYEDDDNDGVTNIHDEDDDGDGIADSKDEDYNNDTDGDGIENRYDSDDDNDELHDKDDDDDDNDGVKDSEDEDFDDKKDNSRIVVLPITYKENAGQLLGSQCAQCHGTNGVSVNSWDSIAGESNLASEIFEDDEPIMSAQAHGYTSEEITLIGNWLKTLSKTED